MEIKKYNFANKILSAWVFAILAVGFLFFYFYQPAIAPERHDKIFCTMEAKLCPDGSYVSRMGPKCDFALCPKQGLGQEDVSTWQTYRNEKYGFEVKIPPDWSMGHGELEPGEYGGIGWVKIGPTMEGLVFTDGGQFGIYISDYLKEIPPFSAIRDTRSDLYDFADYDINNIKEFSIYGFRGGRAISSKYGTGDAIHLYIEHQERIYEIWWKVYNQNSNHITIDNSLMPILSTFRFLK